MDVIEQTMELGRALSQSPELEAMRKAEDAVNADIPTLAIIKAVNNKREELQELLEQENPDTEEIKKLSEELENLEELMRKNELIIAMQKSQEDFARLMARVNAILRFYVTGEIEAATGCGGGGCGGNCAGCRQ